MTTPACDRGARLRAVPALDGPDAIHGRPTGPGGPVVPLGCGRSPEPPAVPFGEVVAVRRGSTLTVRMRGEVDLLLSRALRRALHAVRQHDGPVDIDLRAVTFFSVEAADALVAMHRAHPPGVVALVGISRPVVRTLRACGIPLRSLSHRDGAS